MHHAPFLCAAAGACILYGLFWSKLIHAFAQALQLRLNPLNDAPGDGADGAGCGGQFANCVNHTAADTALTEQDHV